MTILVKGVYKGNPSWMNGKYHDTYAPVIQATFRRNKKKSSEYSARIMFQEFSDIEFRILPGFDHDLVQGLLDPEVDMKLLSSGWFQGTLSPYGDIKHYITFKAGTRKHIEVPPFRLGADELQELSTDEGILRFSSQVSEWV